MAMRNGTRGGKRTKIFVANLPESCRKGELQSLFEKFGNVVECDLVKDYGFVHFDSEDDAKAAVAALNDSDFQGSSLRVEISTSKVRQKPGMGDSTQCYRCAKTGHWSKNCPLGPSRRRDRDYEDGPRGGRYRGRGGGGGRYPPDHYDSYRSRFPPPPSFRFGPYSRERFPPFPPPPEMFFRDRYYERRSPPPRDPYYDMYAAAYERRYGGKMPTPSMPH